MGREKPIGRAAVAALLLIAATFQACEEDAIVVGGDDENGGGSGGGDQGIPDAGDSPAEGDASLPDLDVDAGAGSGNDGDATTALPLVSRQLCFLESDTVRRVSFPAFEVINEFEPEPIRRLGSVRAVDPVHAEVFLERADGLDVFSLDASGLDAPLRSIILPAETPVPNLSVPLFLAVEVDTVNDTLMVLSMDADNFHLSTYPRNAANATQPTRRIDFAREADESPRGDVAIDLERARVVVATPSQLRTFALTATGAAAPLESVELQVNDLTISPARDELHLARGGTAITLDLDSPLDAAPLRSLDELGPIWADDVNGELWVNERVFDIEAAGADEPLYTPPIDGLVRAVLPQRGEWLTQNATNMLLTYERRSSPPAEAPLRVLAAGASGMALVGVHRGRGEVLLREGRNNIVSAYLVGATGATPALRRSWQAGEEYLLSFSPWGTAHDETSGLIFARPVSYEAPVGAYPDNAEGLLQPGPQLARDLWRMEVASARAELLGVKPQLAEVEPVLEAYSLATSSFGTLQRSFSIPSERPNPDTCTYRRQDIAGLAYDPGRDEVIVAVEDCLDGGLECTGGDVSDCHFDLKIFPRTAGPGTTVETVEVFYRVLSVEFDERNDLILLGGEDEVWFLARSPLTGTDIPDAGTPPHVVARTSQGAGSASILYCD